MLRDLRKSFWKYLKDVLAFTDFINITGAQCQSVSLKKHLWSTFNVLCCLLNSRRPGWMRYKLLGKEYLKVNSTEYHDSKENMIQ